MGAIHQCIVVKNYSRTSILGSNSRVQSWIMTTSLISFVQYIILIHRVQTVSLCICLVIEVETTDTSFMAVSVNPSIGAKLGRIFG